MASCSLGSSNIKLFNLSTTSNRVRISQQYGIRSWTGRKSLQNTHLSVSQRSVKFLTACSAPSLKVQSATSSEDVPKEVKSSGPISELIPNLNEVQFLLNEMCDTKSVQELELKLAGFHLHVVRKQNFAEQSMTVPPPTSPSVSANTVTESPDSNGSVSTSSSLAIYKPEAPSGGKGFLDKAADEGLVIVTSPRVGFFRTSRTIKGKRAPPSCKEKQIVKEGQPVCYVEQLGGELPIESDVSGEIVKILREDGEPVGYGDALIAILPSFPGIKLQ